MTYHRLCFKSNTTYATSGLLTASEHLSLLPVVFGIHVSQSILFCPMFSRSLSVLLSFFLLAIVFDVFLRFTYSSYSFGNVRLFLEEK